MKWVMVCLLVMGFTQLADNTPDFAAWVDCVQRGPYEGMAVAKLSYRYDGEFALVAEDNRYFGDTATGETLVFAFQVQPGEHRRFAQISVGAMKAVLWKIVLFGELYVVPVWDDPEVPDCPWAQSPAPTATPAPAEL